jgi:hypothetical protein
VARGRNCETREEKCIRVRTADTAVGCVLAGADQRGRLQQPGPVHGQGEAFRSTRMKAAWHRALH